MVLPTVDRFVGGQQKCTQNLTEKFLVPFKVSKKCRKSLLNLCKGATLDDFLLEREKI